MKLLDLALIVAEKYPVFPCGENKQPVVEGGFKAATRDPDEVRELFRLPGARLIGVPTGHVSGLFVVDVDPSGAGWLAIQRLVLPKTREHKTKRGDHLLFAMPAGHIGCSTGKLAPGVDIRADGGYIIWWPGAGLKFKAEALADAPSEIVAALRRPALDPGDPDDPMSAAHKEKTNVTPEKAAALLRNFKPDDDYDDWLYVGMGLKHEYGDAGLALWRAWSSTGAKYAGDEALETKWDSFRGGDGPPTTLRYLLKMEKIRREKAAAPAPVEGRTSPFPIMRRQDFTARKPPEWIIRGLLPRADHGMIFAVGGAGKTFFTLDMALCIAAGVPWRARPTKRLRVLYICAEGAGGFGLRIQAALQANPLLDDPDAVFEILPGAPNFLDAGQVDGLIAQATLLGGFELVIVDTVAQVTPGGNENSGEDMGQMIASCRKFGQAFGALVLMLHHPGKDSTKGARGWSGVFGALDVEIEITRNGDTRVARVTKQKDGVEGEQFSFRLETQAVDGAFDADGFPVSSCRVVVADLPKNDKPARRIDGPVEALIIKHATELAGVCGGPFDKEQLYRLAVAELEPGGVRDQRRTSVANALNRLKRDGRIIDRGSGLLELPT